MAERSPTETRVDELLYAVAAEPADELELPEALGAESIASALRRFLVASGRTRPAPRVVPWVVAAAAAGLVLGVGSTLWLRGPSEPELEPAGSWYARVTREPDTAAVSVASGRASACGSAARGESWYCSSVPRRTR